MEEKNMNKNKENAQADWIDMIVKSWTWAKLTNDERNKFGDELSKETTKKIISGTYRQRWEILNALVGALRREHHSHEQLEGIVVVQLGGGRWHLAAPVVQTAVITFLYCHD